jgi:hypothetical protein
MAERRSALCAKCSSSFLGTARVAHTAANAEPEDTVVAVATAGASSAKSATPGSISCVPRHVERPLAGFIFIFSVKKHGFNFMT